MTSARHVTSALAVGVATLASLSGCSLIGEQPAGYTESESRDVAPFDRIDLRGAGDVMVVGGDEQSITVEADAAILDDVTTTVVDGVLVLDREGWSLRTAAAEATYTIVVPHLDGASLTGAGSLWVLDLDATSFDIEMSGSGDVYVVGAADTAAISLDGSGRIDAAGFEVDNATVDLSGSGDIWVTANETLHVNLSGSGEVLYEGPAAVTRTISGSGEVRAR